MTRSLNGKLVIATVFAGMVLAGSTAFGQEPSQGTRLLPLRVSSNKLPSDEIARLTETVLAKLGKYPQYQILKVPDVDPMDLMVDADCTDFDAQCLANIGAGRGADFVLYTEVSDLSGRFQVQVRLVDVKTRAVKSPEGGTEDAARLGEFVAVALERIFGPEPQPEPELLKVDIASSPAGGEVYVDRDFVGLTPVAVRLKPGEYTVRIAKVGFKEMVGPMKVEGRKANALSMSLSPVDIPVASDLPVPSKQREVSKTPWYGTWWFWTVVGVVVVGAGTTAGLLLAPGHHQTGSIGLSPNPSLAPKDVTLFSR